MVLEILFSDLDLLEKLLQILFCVLATVLALSIHESFHGIGALAMGDKTAFYQGRITLNPFKHLNLMGAIMLFIFGFGWANPVQINPNNFKNRKAGTIVTSLAGPLSNLLFAFIGAILEQLFLSLAYANVSEPLLYVSIFFSIFTVINLGLAVFNLIPFPPLDGSKVVGECLPFNLKYKYLGLERYSMYYFMALILLTRYLDINILGYAVQFLYNIFNSAAWLIFPINL